MAAFSVKKPTLLCLGISAFLLLIFIQMLTSLMHFAGVFIFYDEARISPFHFRLTRQQGELFYSWWSGAESQIINILTTAVILSLYIPVVLVAFALLAMLLAAYAKDRAAFWFSMACQAASSILILTGVIGFLVLYRLYVSWEHMTIWFYLCVGVQVELVIVTLLTRVSLRRLTSDWD